MALQTNSRVMEQKVAHVEKLKKDLEAKKGAFISQIFVSILLS